MSISLLIERILKQLSHIENIMRAIGLYSLQSPSQMAFASNLPFCCDQMPFNQWLQWVLIPTTRYLLAENRPLPYSNHIYAMAETELATMPQNTDELLLAIQQLDQLFKQL